MAYESDRMLKWTEFHLHLIANFVIMTVKVYDGFFAVNIWLSSVHILFCFLTVLVQGMIRIDLVVTGRTEVVSAVVDLTGKGGQTSRMTCSRKGQQLSRQTKEHLTDPCVMDSPVVRLGMSVQAFVAGPVG